MSTFEFTIIAAGLDIGSADSTDRLFEAGCDDSTISFQRGAIILDFDREARSLGAAIASAVADVEKAGATVIHVEPHHLVSLA